MKQILSNYLHGHFKEVHGWCSPNNWQIIWPIAQYQEQTGIHNPVAEIGVFQGKFLIGLIFTKNVPGNYAIDVFDMQEFNLDGAGNASLEALQNNIVRCGIDLNSVTYLRVDSMSLTDCEIFRIRQQSGGFSLFSVDGCHFPEHTINDIKIGMSLTIPQGLIFVDDYTNPHWPGVQEGVAKLYFNECPRFVPLAFGHNKLFLCHLSYHRKFLQLITNSLQGSKITYKMVRRFGYDSISVNLDPASQRYLPD